MKQAAACLCGLAWVAWLQPLPCHAFVPLPTTPTLAQASGRRLMASAEDRLTDDQVRALESEILSGSGSGKVDFLDLDNDRPTKLAVVPQASDPLDDRRRRNERYNRPEHDANRQRAFQNRMKRVSGKVAKRRVLIEANQRMLLRERREQVVRKRGENPVHRMDKDAAKELHLLEVGQWLEGQVTRLLPYGAWVDVGSSTDGFMHISEISETFLQHPADALEPGQAVTVRVRQTNPSKGSLSLSRLKLDPDMVSPYDGKPRVPLDELFDEQQLWGHVKRVTNFGAYVDVGAERDGFLHVSEWPARLIGEMGPDVFSRGQRLRVYVMDVDLEMSRVKLTARRPESLPQLPA